MSDQDKINRLLDHGLTCYGLGQVEEALSMWREVLDLEPGNPRALEYIQFVESNWRPSQPREAQPYRPDESSGEIDVSDVPIPDRPSTEPAPAKPAPAKPAPAKPAPAKPKVEPRIGNPADKAFVEPFKPAVQPGAWGDLYDFDKKAGQVGIPAPEAPPKAPVAEEKPEERSEWSVWTPGPGMLPDPLPSEPAPIASPSVMPALNPNPEPVPAEEAAAEGQAPEQLPAKPIVVQANPPPAFPPKPQAPAFPPKPESPPDIVETAAGNSPQPAPEAPVILPAAPPPEASAQDGWGAVGTAPPEAPPPVKSLPVESPPAEPAPVEVAEPVKINPVPPFAKSAGPSSGGALDLVGAGSTPAWAAETPRPAKTLLQGAKDMLQRDDFSGAVELLEKAHDREPEHSEVKALLQHARSKLEHHMRVRLGDTSLCPQVRMSGDEIIWLNLDSRAGFLLSLLDGHTSIDDLLSICGLPALDALRILVQLVDESVIALD